MSLCPPRRNDSPLSTRHIGVDDRNLNAIYDTNGIYACLAVLKATVHFLKRRTLEDPDSVLERNTVMGNVPAILLCVPSGAHGAIFTLCIYAQEAAGPLPESRLPFS